MQVNYEWILPMLVMALAASAISITTSRSKVFRRLRFIAEAINPWLGELSRCFYCTSHWVNLAFVIIYQPYIIQQVPVVDLVLSWFALVGLTALISGAITNLIHFQASEEYEKKR